MPDAPARRTTLGLQPDNLSLLSPNAFRLYIDHIPNAIYFNDEATIPGVTVTAVEVARPDNVAAWVPGNNIIFDDFRFTYKVDENMTNLVEMYNWIWRNTKTNRAVMSDASLTILTNNFNPLRTIRFYNMFPTMMTEVPLTVMDGPDAPIQMAVSFKYTHYEFLPLNTVVSS